MRASTQSDRSLVESLGSEADDGAEVAALLDSWQELMEPPRSIARVVGTWVDAPSPPVGTDALVGRLSRVGSSGLKMVLTKAFLESWSSPAQRLAIIERLMEAEAISKSQGLRLTGEFVPPTFEKTVVSASFTYTEPGNHEHGPRQASLELLSNGGAVLMVTEELYAGMAWSWAYSCPNAAEESDETTLRLRGTCTSEPVVDEICFEMRLLDGGGWRGKVGGPAWDAKWWEAVFWSNPVTGDEIPVGSHRGG